MLFQIVSLNYNAYGNVEGIKLGIPFVYWLEVVNNSGNISLYLNRQKLIINLVMLTIIFILFYLPKGLVFTLVYLSVPTGFAILRPFLGQASDYSCNCYGFPLGFIMECNYADDVMLDTSLFLYSVLYVLVLLFLMYISKVKEHKILRIVLFTVTFYLILGATHMCSSYILSYLGYTGPGLSYGFESHTLNVDYYILIADLLSSLAIIYSWERGKNKKYEHVV